MIDKLVVYTGRVGFTDIYHEAVQRRGALGKLFVLLFGTPQLGCYANGIYLRRFLKNSTYAKVLDAGCGDGTFTFYVARHFPQSQITGVDIGDQGEHHCEDNLGVCERAQQQLKLPNIRFRELDLLELNDVEVYDFVYSFDVLEHIKENRLVLENIHRALKTGGKFLLRIPTKIQSRILPNKFTAEHARWAVLEHLGQHYDMDGLVTDLRSIGFTIVDAQFTMGNFGRLSFELAEALHYYSVPQPVYFAAIPVLKVLRRIDTLYRPQNGDGLLVFCEK